MSQDTQSRFDTVFHNVADAETREVADRYRSELSHEFQTMAQHVESLSQSFTESKRIAVNSKTFAAIALLGEFRRTEATNLLANLIDVRDDSFSVASNEQPHFQSFPAAVALANIGMPTIEAMIANLRSSEPNSTKFQLSVLVIEAILAPELARSCIAEYAEHFTDLAHGERSEAIKALLEQGHRRWQADGAADFSLD